MQKEGEFTMTPQVLTPRVTVAEAEELQHALESYLDDLRIEIATTNAWDLLTALKERRNSRALLPRHANGDARWMHGPRS